MALLLLPTTHAQAPTSPVEAPQALSRLLTREEVQTLVYQSAERVGLNKALKEQMFQTVLDEAEKTKIDGEVRYIADGQSTHTLSYGREQSYGLAMWHIPAGNKDMNGELITEQSAKDPVYALDQMAWYFFQNKQGLWSAWRALYAS